jgi:SAM-dependent methyltransferase
MNIAQLWDICLSFEYDRRALVSSICEWIANSGKCSILDVACGTGFPAIDLLKRGFRVTCCDGSSLMLQEFRRNATIAGVSAEPNCILWQELKATFPCSFEILMCRGNSLVYAGTWDECCAADPHAILESLDNFYHCLKPGGIIYVDTVSEKYINNPFPESRVYPEKIIAGRLTQLSETVYTDRICRTRTWIPKVTVDGNLFEFKRHSYFLPHSDLCNMLCAVGFRDVTRFDITGEHYSVFLGRKE